MLLYYLALAFIGTFAVHQVVGFSLIALTSAVLVLGRLATGRALVVNRKDLLFAIYAALSVVVVVQRPSDITFLARLVIYPWMISFVFQNISYTERRVRSTFAVAVVAAVSVASVMLFQVEPGRFDISLQRLITLDRSRGFYFVGDERIGPNTAAAMSASAIVLLLSYLKFDQKRTVALLGIIAVPVVFLIVAGGRNALVSTALCVIVFLFYSARGLSLTSQHRWARGLMLLGTLSLLGWGVASGISSTQGNVLADRLSGLLSPTADHNVQVRFAEWVRAAAMFREEPLGWGFNAYYSRFDRTPHNELLGQLVAVGWIATTAYFILIGYIWLYLARMPRTTITHDRIRFVALCLMLIYTLGMTTENISRGGMNTFAPILWMSLGMAFSGGGKSRVPIDSDGVTGGQGSDDQSYA